MFCLIISSIGKHNYKQNMHIITGQTSSTKPFSLHVLFQLSYFICHAGFFAQSLL